MGPVKERNRLPEIILCHCLIGKEHKIFNDLCSYIPFIRMDIHRFPLLIQNDLTFRKIKVDGPPFAALLP